MREQPDFSQYNLEELNQMKKAIDNEIERKQKSQVQAVISQVEELVQSAGISVEELNEHFKKRRHGKPAKPKYCNPDSPEQTWSGRGKQPRWYREARANGVPEEELLVESVRGTAEA
ncbi:MAG: H-NS family nucleoid-associated regulatory protein [Candidatus Competibacterales bacterium]